MTLQDLKDNRQEIISLINELCSNPAEQGREVMNTMVQFINHFDDWKEKSTLYIEDFVKEVVEIKGFEKKEREIRLVHNGVVYDNLSDYNRACSRTIYNKR